MFCVTTWWMVWCAALCEQVHAIWQRLSGIGCTASKQEQEVCIYVYSTATKISPPYIITIRPHFCDVNTSLFQKEQEKKWIHEMHADWQNYGECHTSVPELGKDGKWFYIQFWMSTDCCDEILNIITDDIRKENTNYHAAISPEERLAIALR